MAARFRVRLLTPARTVLDREVVSLLVPGSEGFLGVLAHHAPLITALRPGPLTLRDETGAEDVFAVSGGVLEVSGNQATILADAAERPSDIDLERATAALGRARLRLAEPRPETDISRAEAALARALNRLRVVERHGASR
ncbi:MAG: F0F1 ATP synthase subunit epsilon [Candidatus Eisenbacteria bacterium]